MNVGTLKTSPGTSVVSWKDGKRQIRAALKAAVLNLTLYAELAHPRADAPMTAVEREQALLICAATQEVGEV
jgi:hypothetical protein